MGLPKVKGKAETILEIALALTLLRPDWKSLLPTQITTSEVAGHNASDSYLTKHTNTDNYNALTDLTSWDSAGESVHFSNDLIAMLNTVLGENTASESCDESGYSSGNPSSPGSSCGGSLFLDMHSDQQQGLLYEDESYLGATGYTPPPDDSDKSPVWDLEDFVDLSSIETPPVDKQPWNWPTNLQVDLDNSDVSYSKSKQLHSKQYPMLASDEDEDFDGKMSNIQEDVLLQPSFYSQDPPDLYSIDFGLKSEAAGSPDPEVNFSSIDPELFFGELDLPLDILDTRSMNASCSPSLTSCNNTEPPTGFVVNTTAQPMSPVSQVDLVKVENEEGHEEQEETQSNPVSQDEPSKKAKGERRSTPPAEIDLTEDEITELPVTQFNDYIGSLPDTVASVARDIRRRGKNKEAARICRKRKMDTISTLEDEIALLASRKDLLLKENKLIDDENSDLKQKIGSLYQYVFASLRDENGQPLSPSEHSLLHAANGCLYLVPNSNNSKKSLKVKS